MQKQRNNKVILKRENSQTTQAGQAVSLLQRLAQLAGRGFASLRRDGVLVTFKRVIAFALNRYTEVRVNVHQPLIPYLQQIGAEIIGETALQSVLADESMRVLLVADALIDSTATRALMSLADWLRRHGFNTVIAAAQTGPLAQACESEGIPVILYRPLLMHSHHCVNIAFPFNLVVAGAAAAAPAVQSLMDADIPILWWMHESDDSQAFAALPEQLSGLVTVCAATEAVQRALQAHRPLYHADILPVPAEHADAEDASLQRILKRALFRIPDEEQVIGSSFDIHALVRPAAQRASVSVVIPAYNGGEEIDALLTRLEAQKELDSLEIVVVDSGSRDNTTDICRSHGVKLIEIPNAEFTHSHARNLGAQAATGDILMFMTQDAMPSSDRWAAGLIAPILRGEAVAVSPCEDAPASSDLYYSVSSWNHRHFLCPDGKDRLCDSLGDGNRQTYHANASLNDVTTAIDRRVFLRFGYRQDFAEDLDMGARLLRCGYALKLLSSVRTVHGHSRQTGYYFRRSLVGHQTTMERIIHTPVAGTSTLKTVASTAVTGYEQMQQILAQLDAAACDSLDAYAEAWSKAFRKARVESRVTPAQPAAPYRDETLEAAVDLLRPYADLRKPDGWMLDAISSFWNGTMLPFLREKDMPWTSDLQHDVSDALQKHLAVLIGIRLGELPADNPIADRLNQFRKGV